MKGRIDRPQIFFFNILAIKIQSNVNYIWKKKQVTTATGENQQLFVCSSDNTHSTERKYSIKCIWCWKISPIFRKFKVLGNRAALTTANSGYVFARTREHPCWGPWFFPQRHPLSPITSWGLKNLIKAMNSPYRNMFPFPHTDRSHAWTSSISRGPTSEYLHLV